ncbi:MAG: hypothetical protein WB763_01295 [Terriglobia bacterium]
MESAKVVVTEQGRRRPATQKGKKTAQLADHAAFGMWADREDMKDVHAWLKKIRAPRYDRLGRHRPKP